MGYRTLTRLTVTRGVTVALDARFHETMRQMTAKVGLPVDEKSYKCWIVWYAFKWSAVECPDDFVNKMGSGFKVNGMGWYWPRFDDLLDHVLGTTDHDLTFVWEMGGACEDPSGGLDRLVIGLKGTTHTFGTTRWNSCDRGHDLDRDEDKDNIGPHVHALKACTLEDVKATAHGACRYMPDVDPEAISRVAAAAATIDLERAHKHIKTVLNKLGLRAVGNDAPEWCLLAVGYGG